MNEQKNESEEKKSKGDLELTWPITIGLILIALVTIAIRLSMMHLGPD